MVVTCCAVAYLGNALIGKLTGENLALREETPVVFSAVALVCTHCADGIFVRSINRFFNGIAFFIYAVFLADLFVRVVFPSFLAPE